MKFILLIFGFITVTATTIKVTAGKEAKVVTDDKEFQQFMNEFNSTLSKNRNAQIKADKAKEAIVTSTVTKISEIKQEITTLKTELHEAKQALDSVNADTASSFNILAISNH